MAKNTPDTKMVEGIGQTKILQNDPTKTHLGKIQTALSTIRKKVNIQRSSITRYTLQMQFRREPMDNVRHTNQIVNILSEYSSLQLGRLRMHLVNTLSKLFNLHLASVSSQ